jgi:hypothetical protein
MTRRQIAWAMSHDWFHAVASDGATVLVWDRAYNPATCEHFEMLVSFIDFPALRAWAGY